MTEPATPPIPRLSATILLVRDLPSFEVLMVKRHHQIDFASGALVFPGGKTEPSDGDDAWADRVLGWDEFDLAERTLRIAAIREAYEEAGILLARTGDGTIWAGAHEAVEARSAVARGEASFMDLVDTFGLKLDLPSLTPFARWITPVMMPKRFDTHFFLAVAPADQLAVCDGHETVDAEWIEPGAALAMAAEGQRTIIFPTRMNLKLLAESPDARAAASAALARPGVVVTPWVEQRATGQVLVIPPDAGYGSVEEDLASVGT
jgi:8-oxo-dGTP pyrophosphatase MutT (NUDIX family)